MLLLFALLGCRADEAADLLDYPSEVEITIEADGDVGEVAWTVEARRHLKLKINSNNCNAYGEIGVGVFARFDCTDFDEEGWLPLGRGDAPSIQVFAGGHSNSYADFEDAPAEQIVSLPFWVWKCRAFDADCDNLHSSLGGEIQVLVRVPQS